jgi:hypothetical protein
VNAGSGGPKGASEGSGWWRRNRGWLLGSAILAIPAFGWPLYGAWQQYNARFSTQPIDVPAGQWGQLEGARWRLLGIERTDVTRQAGLREDAVVLLVRYEVVLDEGTSPERIDICRGRLVDAQGRKWDANIPALSVTRGELPRNCASRWNPDTFKTEPVRTGEPFVFEHAYLIPSALPSAGLRPGIWFPPSADAKQPGMFLRFDPA